MSWSAPSVVTSTTRPRPLAMRQAFVDPTNAWRIASGRGRVVDRHVWIAADVLDLLPALGGVNQDVLAVGLDPHLGVLRRAVGHECGELAIGWLSHQLPKSGGYGLRHR